MASGRPKKEFHEYLITASDSHVSHGDYIESPASALLKYTIEAKSSIDLCIRKFPKNQNKSYSKDSYDSLQHLIIAILPAIMGHFETFERNLFAGMFDLSVYLKDFNIEKFFDCLDKKFSLDPIRLSAHRGIGTSSIGLLLADSLSSWHDPERVNNYFSAFKLNYQLFGNGDISKLNVLWQLRHSIVHTGGTLTLPDAQKVNELKAYGNNQIAFDKNFIFEVSRKLHPIVKKSCEGIGNAFKAHLISDVPQDQLSRIDKFFTVKSSIPAWFK